MIINGVSHTIMQIAQFRQISDSLKTLGQTLRVEEAGIVADGGGKVAGLGLIQVQRCRQVLDEAIAAALGDMVVLVNARGQGGEAVLAMLIILGQHLRVRPYFDGLADSGCFGCRLRLSARQDLVDGASPAATPLVGQDVGVLLEHWDDSQQNN